MTKQPKIFHVNPDQWSEQIKQKAIPQAQIVILIVPDEITDLVKQIINETEIPHVLVS